MLKGIYHIQVEAAFAHSPALVGILAGVCAAGCDRRYGYGICRLSVVPEVVVCPSGRCSGIEGHIAACQYCLDGILIDCAVNGNLVSHYVWLCITADSDSECLLTRGAVLGGVGNAVDVAAVCLHGNLTGSLACAPLPLSAVCRSPWQLRNECYVGTVGRYSF